MTDKKMTKAEERRQDKARHDDMRYIKGLYPARKIPRGRILAHNRVMHTVDMPNGLNGFRCWTWREGLQPEHFVPLHVRLGGAAALRVQRRAHEVRDQEAVQGAHAHDGQEDSRGGGESRQGEEAARRQAAG